jgi:hypothetical protein
LSTGSFIKKALKIFTFAKMVIDKEKILAHGSQFESYPEYYDYSAKTRSAFAL